METTGETLWPMKWRLAFRQVGVHAINHGIAHHDFFDLRQIGRQDCRKLFVYRRCNLVPLRLGFLIASHLLCGIIAFHQVVGLGVQQTDRGFKPLAIQRGGL